MRDDEGFASFGENVNNNFEIKLLDCCVDNNDEEQKSDVGSKDASVLVVSDNAIHVWAL